MPIELTGIQSQCVRWAPTTFSGLTRMLGLVWAKCDFPTTSGISDYFGKWDADSASGSYTKFTFQFSLFNSGGNAGKLAFRQSFTGGTFGSGGMWRTTSAGISDNVLAHAGFYFDRSSASNDPRFYIAGVYDAPVEVETPSGTAEEHSADDISIGDLLDTFGDESNKGPIYSITVFDMTSINPSTAQIDSWVSEAFASRLAKPKIPNCVFAPILCGASSGATDGSTLTSSNKIVDSVSGALGTPNGGCVLRADDFLIYD